MTHAGSYFCEVRHEDCFVFGDHCFGGGRFYIDVWTVSDCVCSQGNDGGV